MARNQDPPRWAIFRQETLVSIHHHLGHAQTEAERLNIVAGAAGGPWVYQVYSLTPATGGPTHPTWMHITTGLPGSGKTRWAKAWLSKDRPGRARFSRDEARRTHFGGWSGMPSTERIVSVEARAGVIEAHLRGRSVVMDATHLVASDLKESITLGRALGMQVCVHQFTTDPLVCIPRDAKRPLIERVGEAVIYQMAGIERAERHTRGDLLSLVDRVEVHE